MIYFSSDFHFFHSKIREYMPKRPGNTVEEMNEILIKNWNETVTKNDTVYILGDFSFGKPEPTYNIIRRLNGGTKILILGNHDRITYGPKSGIAFTKTIYNLTIP